MIYIDISSYITHYLRNYWNNYDNNANQLRHDFYRTGLR